MVMVTLRSELPTEDGTFDAEDLAAWASAMPVGTKIKARTAVRDQRREVISVVALVAEWTEERGPQRSAVPGGLYGEGPAPFT